VTAAVLGSISALLIYLVGHRFFDRRVGLVSATLMAVAFLPVYQAKIAVNDVPSVVPVALALFGAGGIVRWGRRLDYMLAGAGLGLAIGIKYTAGMVLVALLAAAAADLRRRGGQALPVIALGALSAVGAFALTTPISVLDPQKYFGGLLGHFKVTPPGEVKLGQGEVNGLLHYLWVFSWGFGWLPSLTAIGGAFVLVRRNLLLATVLVPAPVLYVVFMAMRNVYVSRYMLPVFPFVAVLAGYGLCTLVPAVFGRHRRLVAPVLVVAVIAVTLQSVIHDVHVGQVHSRPNTREVALNWMVDNIPHDAKVAIEPMYMRPELPGSGNIDALSNEVTPWRLVAWPRPDLTELRTELLDALERRGVCWVVTGTTQEAIAREEPERLPGAIAFYDALERREDLMHRIDPFKPGSEPIPFNFDWAINYYPLEYERPGPEIYVYRLQHKACG
jgi:hypothetical protein